MIIDYKKLSVEALNGLIESFVCREGTDYGEIEWRLDQKVEQVKQQLQNGEAAILFDHDNESTTIVPVDGIAEVKSVDRS